jgi:putative transposase
MPNYRRNYQGIIFFLTLVTQDRRAIFRSARARRLLREVMEQTCHQRPWTTEGIVLLPDHLHLLWRMPAEDRDYSTRIASIKRRFTRAYLAAGGCEAAVTGTRMRQGYRGIWQRRFWEHTIRDARDFRRHLDYIHLNPVKHGLAASPRDWPHSSFHRYLAMGWYAPDWCGPSDLPGSVEYLWVE